MAGFNKVIMMGNLTREPILSYLPSQTPVVDFGLATNKKWTDKNGESRDDTCFVDCRCYAKQAETIAKHFHKGDPIHIEGRLQLDSWQAQDGSKRNKHRVFVENFTFVGSGGGERGDRSDGNICEQPGPTDEADSSEMVYVQRQDSESLPF